MFKICADIQAWSVQFTDQKKAAKKVTKNWNWPFLISQPLEISNINTGHKFKMVWDRRFNLQTRFVQFTDQKKSLNRHKWYTLNFLWIAILKHLQDIFYDSKTQLIQFTDQQKGTKKWLVGFADQIKKVGKSTGKVQLNFP